MLVPISSCFVEKDICVDLIRTDGFQRSLEVFEVKLQHWETAARILEAPLNLEIHTHTTPYDEAPVGSARIFGEVSRQQQGNVVQLLKVSWGPPSEVPTMRNLVHSEPFCFLGAL